MADEKTPGERALDLLQRIVERAGWYYSAIELDHGEDGEALHVEAVAILVAAGRPAERR